MRKKHGRWGWLLVAAVAGSCAHNSGQRVGPPTATGRWMPTTFPSPVTAVGSFPSAMIATPDRRLAVTTDLGGRQALTVLRTSDAKALAHAEFDPPAHGGDRALGLYYGLAMAPEPGGYRLYAAQGAHDSIAVFHLASDGSLKRAGTVKTRAEDFPSGLAVDRAGKLLFVANNYPAVWQTNHPGRASFSVYDTNSRRELGRYVFDADSEFPTSTYPLAVAAMPDGKKVYVSSQRDGCVYVIDTSDPAAPTLRKTIATGAHPAGLLLNRSATTLYVANASSDTVSAVDTGSDSVHATVLVRPKIARGLAGCSPLALALSPDEKTLYVALADLNAVGVIDTDRNALLGYIPAGWYPTGLAATADGKRLLVGDARGTMPRHPNPAPGAPDVSKKTPPIWLYDGSVMTLDAPARSDIGELTEKTLDLARLTPNDFLKDNPLKSVPIKHVLYIIKENRTYDCVLGDVKAGDGDPRRCLFPQPVTPNQHALAARFVLFDNFYDCGEVSGDGWVWSTQGMANEYVTKNVTYNYAHRGRVFDFEGTNSGYPTGGLPAIGPDGKPLSEDPKLKNGLPPIPDVTEAPGGHLWDVCARAGVSFRNYGFFMPVDDIRAKDGHLVLPSNYPAAAGLIPAGHDLEGRTDVDFRKFDLDFADSQAPLHYYKQTGDAAFLRDRREYGKYHADCRFTEWDREFQMMLARDPTGGAVPRMMFMRFPVDHTQAMRSGKPTPRSMVADNDYAVGQIVEAVSHSVIWKDTAIFIIEDDAQDGPDHVDSHRSTCYVISPWIKRNSVDHRFLNTDSVLHTMELLLGVGPMCQLDATAPVIMDWDDAPRNTEPYIAVLPAAKILKEHNAVAGKPVPNKEISPEAERLIRESDKLDFTEEDRVPADEMTALVWKSVRGIDSQPPPTPKGPTPLHAPPGRDADDD